MSLRGTLMVVGTGSDVGKSRIVAGLCRLLARQGVAVAPFKAQNMALNSIVTESGHEIARSQAHQAAAACTAPVVEMNPILLKPTGEMRSQLVVMGRPVGEVGTGYYRKSKHSLLGTALDALKDLCGRYDVVIVEGAGGAAEINLLDSDIANLPLARQVGMAAILVGDIERGGVFASLYGTISLLPESLRAPLAGFVVNKLRGDPRLLDRGIAEIENRSGMPCLGVLPHLGHLSIDAEDSLALEYRSTHHLAAAQQADVLEIAVVLLPHLANFTDFDPLALEPGVALRYVASPGALGTPDLVIVPGSKATVADLSWLRARGLDQAILGAQARGSALLGICAGYQMLGSHIDDSVESRQGEVAGLGLLESTTRFSADKCTRRRRGTDRCGVEISGYEIHHGTVTLAGRHDAWFRLETEDGIEEEGALDGTRGVYATSLHGVFEEDVFRWSFLTDVARRRGKCFVGGAVRFEERRQSEIDRVADAIEAHLDLSRIWSVISDWSGR